MFSHSILAVVLATAWFVGGHFLLSHPLRRAVETRLGPQGFRGLYTVVAAIGLAWMIYAHKTAPYVEWWGDPRWAQHLLLLVMLFIVGYQWGGHANVGKWTAGAIFTVVGLMLVALAIALGG